MNKKIVVAFISFALVLTRGAFGSKPIVAVGANEFTSTQLRQRLRYDGEDPMNAIEELKHEMALRLIEPGNDAAPEELMLAIYRRVAGYDYRHDLALAEKPQASRPRKRNARNRLRM